MSERYGTVVVDPPWRYDGAMPTNVGGAAFHRAELPYPSLSNDAIAALPVAELAAPDCRLFLWATNRHLPAAFGIVEAWGFHYRQLIVWEKTRSTPIGSIAPTRAEFLLVARRGSPSLGTRFPSSVIKASPGRHSSKPELFLDLIEACSPAPRVELIARRNRLGWDTWGNEALELAELPK